MKESYCVPARSTGEIRNLVLIYNGYYENNKGDWSAQELLPYLLYQKKDGSFGEQFFDGFLFLGLLSYTGNQFFEAVDPQKAATWQDLDWYLDKTMNPQGDLNALHEAVLRARKISGNSQLKAKVVLTIPFPSKETFGGAETQKQAICQYVDRMLEMYGPFEKLDTLELSGFYWLHEDAAQKELIEYARKKTKEQGLAFLWIPYYRANGFDHWQKLGFDAAILQPNHYFNETQPIQIQNTAELAGQYGMGIEFEFDERAFEDEGLYRRYLDYLEGAHRFSFSGPDVFKGYYQDVKAIYNAVNNGGTHGRELYEKTFEAATGHKGE